MSHYFLPPNFFLSIYHSSILFFISLAFIYLPSLFLAVWSGFLSVPSGISMLCSITVECIRAQMLLGLYSVPLHSSFTAPPIRHPSLLLWSGSDQSGAACVWARERCWLGSQPIPVVLFHVWHVSPAQLCLGGKKKNPPGFRPRLTSLSDAMAARRLTSKGLCAALQALGEVSCSEVSWFSSCS